MAITTDAIVSGLIGGLVATIVMTIVMMVAGDDSPPPTAQLLAKFSGGAPSDYKMPGMALHLLYGIVAGGVFAAIAGAVAVVGYDTLLPALGWGVVWGLVLMVVGMAVWLRGVIGVEPEREMMMQFGMLHVVYGATLGVWLWLGVF